MGEVPEKEAGLVVTGRIGAAPFWFGPGGIPGGTAPGDIGLLLETDPRKKPEEARRPVLSNGEGVCMGSPDDWLPDGGPSEETSLEANDMCRGSPASGGGDGSAGCIPPFVIDGDCPCMKSIADWGRGAALGKGEGSGVGMAANGCCPGSKVVGPCIALMGLGRSDLDLARLAARNGSYFPAS